MRLPHSLLCRVVSGALSALVLPACSSSEEPSGGGDPASGGSGGVTAAGGTGGSGGSSGKAGSNSSGGASGSVSSGGAGGAPAAGGATAGAGAAAGSSGAGGGSAGATAGGAGAAASAGTGGTAGSGSGTSGAGGSAGSGGAGGSLPCDAVTAVANMKLGWNLGNSLDSIDASKSDTEVETAWGNPRVTRELVAAVAAAGFGAIRIPVTWIGRFGAAPDYTIRPTFFARVEEVVNYALAEELYVIINLHHDGAEGVTGEWITLVDESGQVSDANTQAVRAQFVTMWTQIASHFRDYGERLIFESMNEIKVGYGTPLESYYDQVNALNQAFVTTVRASTGYNPERCLVVPGYNTNIDYTLAGFEKPTDPSAGKLILSAHYYDPWSFAGEASTQTWGAGSPGVDDWGQEDWVRGQVEKLRTAFIAQGLPVIWGEYGAVQQNGYEDYRRYYVEYVTKAVHDAGIVPFLWDNGSQGTGAEAFGFFDRSTNTVRHPELLEALVRAVTSSYELADVAKP